MDAAAEITLTDERIIVIGDSAVGITTAQAVADHGGQAVLTKRPGRQPSIEPRDERTEDEKHATRDERESSDTDNTASTNWGVSDDETESVATDREQIETYDLDSTDEAAVEAFFDEIGAFDHLVCTTKHVPTGGPVETDTEALRDVFAVAFWESYYAAKYSAKHLGEGSSITFVSGNTATKPSVQFFAKGMANAAIETLTKYLAVEIGPVRVNAVSPGRIDALGVAEDTQQSLADSLPAKRIGNPDDIADAILFAITNPHTTGTVIRVDGGDLLV
ncbi:SDR family oxidoreductase [Halocatena marina]|uniref:SDR family oxidoreductase n=1 Tax=Halocatena marina TaxID=2934937 RepID=A0ABD5YW25_9EURY|nr:SDR family oxidoreductase [Halocatena marina]